MKADCGPRFRVQLGDYRADRGLHLGLVPPHLPRRGRRRWGARAPEGACGAAQRRRGAAGAPAAWPARAGRCSRPAARPRRPGWRAWRRQSSGGGRGPQGLRPRPPASTCSWLQSRESAAGDIALERMPVCRAPRCALCRHVALKPVVQPAAVRALVCARSIRLALLSVDSAGSACECATRAARHVS
jgi:hypothetical protein